ncbi:MAG: hypothetical protein HUU29_06445 [Planctomycetaceae bacterium]|nr:hypothetical protein [Planctomycetaceae bacterium]
MRFVAWLETTLTNIDSIGALEKRWRASPKSAEIAFELRDMAVSLCRYELACEVYEALDTIEDPVVKQKEAAIEACIQRFQIMLEVDTIACIKRNEDIKVSDRTFQYVASHLERFIAAKKQDDAFEFAAYTTEAWAGWMCPSVEKSLALIEKLVAAFPAHQDVAFVCGCAGRLAIQNDSDDVASRGKKLLEKALAIEYEQAREEARERQADKPEEASKYVWLESLDDAIAAAKKEGKWVLVVREDG